MATIRTESGTFNVPDDVVPDYIEEGADLAARTVDDTWTVAHLRARARDLNVQYKGLTKAQLLTALR